MKRFSLRRLLFAAVLSAMFFILGLSMRQVGSYFNHLDAYSGDIVRQDESAARDHLKDLEYFYEQNRRFGAVRLSWIAERYLFKDLACQRAAYFNLSRNFSKTIEEELKDREGFCASFLRANARWRQAQAIYANALTLPDKTTAQRTEKAKQKELANEMAATLVKDDYEAALKANPSHHASSWNYDLVSDSDSRARALAPKPGVIYRIRLGQGPGGSRFNPGPKGEEDKKGEGNKSKDIDTKEEGPGRPGGKPRKVG